MLKLLRSLCAPTISLVILMLGCSFFTTLLTVRIHLEGSSPWLVGIMTAAFYSGYMIGSFRTESLVARVGLIRAYSTFAAILATTTLMQGLFFIPWLWITLRFIGGICVGGLLIVIQSWMLCYSSTETRGRILAVYMTFFYAAQSVAQLLLNVGSPKTVLLFAITSMLCSLSIVPVSSTHVQTPSIEKSTSLSFFQLVKLSPAGIITCFIAGNILGSIYGIYPLYISQIGYSVYEVSILMSIIIFGSMVIQYPVGYISDHANRQFMIVGLSVFAISVGLLMMFFARTHLSFFMVLSFLLGGFISSLYSVGISHACDQVDHRNIVAATQNLTLSYSVGAIIGPLFVPFFMHAFGPQGLIICFLAELALLAAAMLWYLKNQGPHQ